MTVDSSRAIHTGVSLAVEQDDSGLLATMILARVGNKLSQVSRSPLADALARAKNVSSDSGFEGYYDITGLPTIKPEGLGGVLREIDRQSNELQPKTGFHWGATPQWTPNELAGMPAAQAHSARLARLRDALVKGVGKPQSR
jgi:hypothetical protein